MNYKATQQNNISKKLKAFTLVELLIVMAIFTFVAGLVLPGTITQIKSTSLNGKVSELTSQIYLYQQNAYNGLKNKTYGVRFNNTSYTIFIGPSFAAAESKADIALDPGMRFSSVALVGGGSDLIFTNGTLKPNTPGNVSITNTVETYQLTINSEGYIEYNKV